MTYQPQVEKIFLPLRSVVLVAFFFLSTFCCNNAVGKDLEVGQVFSDCDRCPELVVVPSGSFEMRTAPWGPGRGHNDGYYYPVSFQLNFAVGRYEITNADWEVCVEDGGCEALKKVEGARPRLPVVNVSWRQARLYTKWLSRITGYRYRLPSNSEWEYAARAGLGMNRYFDIPPEKVCDFGNTYDESADKALEYGLESMPCNDGETSLSEVGKFKPNDFGIHDAIGNVFEWTEDCSSPDWRGAPVDGRPWLKGDCSMRGYRGSSWLSNEPFYVVESSRFKYLGSSEEDLGFRVVREINN